MADPFTNALGDRRGAATATVASTTTPHVRAQQLVMHLAAAPPTSRTSLPGERLNAVIRDYELAAAPLATRACTHGLLCLFELTSGRFSHTAVEEHAYRAFLIWEPAPAGWALFEPATAAVPEAESTLLTVLLAGLITCR